MKVRNLNWQHRDCQSASHNLATAVTVLTITIVIKPHDRQQFSRRAVAGQQSTVFQDQGRGTSDAYFLTEQEVAGYGVILADVFFYRLAIFQCSECTKLFLIFTTMRDF